MCAPRMSAHKGSSFCLAVLLVCPSVIWGYQLTAPRNYTAYAGSIPVTYSIPEDKPLQNGYVQLVSLSDEHVVAEVPLPRDYYGGEMTFICGVVDKAGRYVFRMLDHGIDGPGPTLAESEVVVVSWPRTTLTLPMTHVTLSNPVTLRVSVMGALCESTRANSSYRIDLEYHGRNESVSHFTSGAPQIVHTEHMTQLSNLRGTAFRFDCTLFDQAGTYQAVFRSAHAGLEPIALSNQMHADWSEDYSLSTMSTSIMPCRRYLVMTYKQASCSGHNDRVRMYKQVHKAGSSIASPIDLVYQTERRARTSQNAVTFNCDIFHESVVGYCFKYISTAASGAVDEQYTLCLPTNDIEAIVVDGEWSNWGGWGACSVSCGSGQQNRVRTCDNPAPSIGGQYCIGETYQWRDCGNACKETTTRLPFSAYTPDSLCECGCELLEDKGTIVSSKKCRGSNLWVVRAIKGHVIQLDFIHFTVDPSNSQTWVKVRDGDSHMSNLLLHNFGEGVPRVARSTSNSMLIEYMAPFEAQGGYKLNAEGFVASYVTLVDNTTVLLPGPDGARKQRIWESTITVVGIILCGVIILATIAFVCHHRVTTKRKQEKRAHAQETLLTNGGFPNSPSHSGSGLGSPNASYADPLGSPIKGAAKSPTKRDYVKPHTPTSMSGVSRGSEGSRVRKHHPPGVPHPGGMPGGREVPIGPSRMSSQSSISAAASMHTSPLPSPYSAVPGDYNIYKPSSLQGEPPAGKKYPHRGGHPRSRPPAGTPEERAISPASTAPSRGSARRTGKMGVPLAGGEEDLSPASPTHPGLPHSPLPLGRRGHHGATPENIQLDSLKEHPGKKRHRGSQDTSLSELSGTRPPVEGRDSLTRKTGRGQQQRTPTQRAPQPLNTPDRQNANFIPGPGGEQQQQHRQQPQQRPNVKPLPLRDVQRPDGQSPEGTAKDPNANSPTSHVSSELSPGVLRPSKLFSDSQATTPSGEFVTNEDFEYDDYVPTLPGSYFTMDPHAYQLTWSQQPPWARQQQASRTASQASMDPPQDRHPNNGQSNC